MNQHQLVEQALVILDSPADIFWTPEEIAIMAQRATEGVRVNRLRPITERLMYRPPTDRDDVYAAHDRFRRCYLRNGVSLNLCRCMAHVEPHLHAPHKLTRIGHLPMFTMKELPE